MASARIKNLIDEAHRAAESSLCKTLYDERRRRWEKWSRGREVGRPPITVFSRPHDWANELGFDLLEYYNRPEAYLEANLRVRLYVYEHVAPLFVAPYDEPASPRRMSLEIDFGGAFEPSLLGVKAIFRPDGTPWPGSPVVREEKDLEKLSFPDFERSGLMPRVHHFHDEIEKIGGRLSEEISVDYPAWTRSPWGVAVHMMGWQNILLNLVKRPQLVHKLLSFITEARIAWEKERAAFLGQEVPRASSLGNDEVGSRLFSAQTYRGVILPYERRLADFYRDGISYFHSCNDITAFLPDIIKIRGMRTIHVSPWTDLKAAVQVLGGRFEVQKWMHPADMIASDEEKRARLREAIKMGSRCRMSVINAGAVRDTISWLKAIQPLIDDAEEWMPPDEAARALNGD